MSTPAPCVKFKASRIELAKQIAIRNKMLIQGKTGPKPGKPDPEILGEKNALVKELAAVEKKWNTCMAANGGLPDLNAVFSGQVKLTIQDSNPQVRGPFTRNLSIGLFFDHWEHIDVTVTSFPKIVVGPFDVPNGTDTITITLLGTPFAGGTFDRDTGALDLSFGLHFDHSNAFAHNSNITFNLSTKNAGGHAFDAVNHVVMTGTSTFQGGFFDGDAATAVVMGSISPRP